MNDPAPTSTVARVRGFFGSSVARPVAALVGFVTLIVVGVISYREIPLQLLPSGFAEPSLNVWIPTPESSAQENEQKVARIIEEQLRTMPGIEEVISRSNADRVYMRISLSSDTNIDLGKAEVRDRIERARPSLPQGVERISMWTESADSMPLAFFGLLHSGSGERTDYLIDKVVTPRLEGVRGVSKIDVWGGGADSVRILLDEDRVSATQLDLGELIARLSADNFTSPLGNLDTPSERLLLRSDMRFESEEQIAEFPIGNGLRLKDVGEVRRVKSVRNQLSRINGRYSYTGMVERDSRINVVEASRNLRAAMDEIAADPRVNGELEFVTFFVQGDLVESSLGQLQETAAWGGALAVVVLFVFLRRVRLTLCVALSIPVSALMAIAWEYFAGGSFNVLTMAGVTLAMGMLVDNSVVVVENITRFRERGESGLDASAKGAREIALAVTLATLTTVVVFLPLMFVGGNPMVDVIFQGIGQPLCVALVFSLVVALVFLPVIAGRILGEQPRFLAVTGRAVEPIAQAPVKLVSALVGLVRMAWFGLVRAAHRVNRFVLWILRPLPVRIAVAAVPPWLAWQKIQASVPSLELAAAFDAENWGQAKGFLPVVLGAQALIASAFVLFVVPRWARRSSEPPTRPASWMPRDRSLVDMVISLNRNVLTWTLQHRLLAAVVSLLCFATIQIPIANAQLAAFMEGEDTQSVRFYLNFDADFTLAEAADEIGVYEEYVEGKREAFGYENWSCRFDDRGGRFEIYWPRPLPAKRLQEVKNELKLGLPKRPGHEVRWFDGEADNERQRNVVVFSLRGPDSGVLETLGQDAVRVLESVPGLEGVQSPLENGPETLQIEIDRDMALTMGVDSETAVNTVSYTLRGWQITRFFDDGREIPLIIEFDEEEVAGIGTLKDLTVFTPQGRVPLSSFSDLVVTRGDRSVFRRNGQADFTVTAEVEDPTQIAVLQDRGNAALLAGLDLPRGYSLGLDDSLRSRQEEEFEQMGMALGLSVVLVFLLMGILFESVLLPFSVLFTIPFAVLGALWTILLTGIPMDFMGWIGLIILTGVVVNNGIVLIDRIHRLAETGMPRSEAVVTGCGERVRPVLMTALTTVCGLLPMALFEPATNSIAYQALATVVAGGLVTSTFFTLWVVPLAYTVFDDISHLASARLRWWLRVPSRGARPALES